MPVLLGKTRSHVGVLYVICEQSGSWGQVCVGLVNQEFFLPLSLLLI